MSRPIGIGIRSVCEAVNWIGPCGSRDVALWAGMSRCDVSRYAGRAESHGLLKIDRSTRPNKYAVVHGWKYRIDGLKDKASAGRLINSVFELGAQA